MKTTLVDRFKKIQAQDKVSKMGKLSLNEYQVQALTTAGTHTHPEVYGALAVAGEAGEVADAIKKKVFHGAAITNVDIAKELGDVLWGLAYLAHYLGYTLQEIAEMNTAKLKKRFPHGYVTGGGIR